MITRFAPSPTGFLHIGGARTAIFNWLYAKHCDGQVLLRIEDTDRARSTDEAVKAIFDGLKWLKLDFDQEPVFQFSRMNRHAEVAHQMVKNDKAYYCYCSQEELEQMRKEATESGKSPKYNRKCISCTEKKHDHPVVRLKVEQSGYTTINDLVQGEVRVDHSELDDMILLRSDGTPTYMLSVVVDDYDMNVTNIIRGDDHLTNTFRQIQIYTANGWDIPTYAHIPLIHGADGAKLSKRHGAMSVMEYKELGFLSDAVFNYLIRLGWGHGDDEIFSKDQAIEWFDINDVGAAPSRLDFDKLKHINGCYIRNSNNDDLINEMCHFKKYSQDEIEVLKRAMDGLKLRAKTIVELVESSVMFFDYIPQSVDDGFVLYLKETLDVFESKIKNWTLEDIEKELKEFAFIKGLAFGKIAGPLRQIISGAKVSPSVLDVIYALGKDEVKKRIELSLNA